MIVLYNGTLVGGIVYLKVLYRNGSKLTISQNI